MRKVRFLIEIIPPDIIERMRSIAEELRSRTVFIQLEVSEYDIESGLEKYPKARFTSSVRIRIHLSSEKGKMCSGSLGLTIVTQSSEYTKIRLLPIPDT